MVKRDKRGNPVVYRFNYKYSPQPPQHFMDLHECARHQIGDVDLPHRPRNSPDHIMNESTAYCIATPRIRDEIGTGRDVVLQAVQRLVEDMVKIGFSATTTYSQKSNILNQLEKEEAAETFIDQILRHRELRQSADSVRDYTRNAWTLLELSHLAFTILIPFSVHQRT